MFYLDLGQRATYTLAIFLPLALQIAGLFFSVLADTYLDKKQKRVYILTLFFLTCLIAQNYGEMLLARGEPKDFARTISAIIGYVLRPAIIVLFYYLVDSKRTYRLAWTIVGINAALYLTALFSPLCFYIEDNHYHGGPLSNTCLVVSLVLLAGLVWYTIRKSRESRAKAIAIAIIPIVLIGVWLDYGVGMAEQPVDFLTIAIAGCCTLYYVLPHLQEAQHIAQEKQKQQQAQIMVSQIQPHFMYNTLSVIYSLCDADRELAKEAILKFSSYLRANMASLQSSKPVPFEQELEHTKTYLWIEQQRFGDILKVEYDVAVTDFVLPAISLQPLVENAVKYGVRSREEGGTVTISTRRENGKIYIRVTDDGMGFDPQTYQEDGRLHIGIENVRTRLQLMRGGRLEIESASGSGTTATMILEDNYESIVS